MEIKIYKVALIINKEQEEKLCELEKRLNRINGWSKQDILQFCVSARPQFIGSLLNFMDIEVEKLEQATATTQI